MLTFLRTALFTFILTCMTFAAQAGEIPAGLMEAIRTVECPVDEAAAKAAYRREDALGDYQIRPSLIGEVNRILAIQKKTQRFKHEDALDRKKAEQMFVIYQTYWATKHKDWSAEGMAKRWNGGPTWTKPVGAEKITRNDRLETTLEAYWHKVQANLPKKK